MVAVTLMLPMSGCALSESVDLTEEQSALIAEYAAGELLRHTKSGINGIRYLSDVDFDNLEPKSDDVGENPEGEVTEMTAEETSNEAIDENTEAEAGEEAAEAEISADDMEPVVEAPAVAQASIPFEEALGLSGMTIQYTGYRFMNVYPPEDSDELVFSLQASPNMKLLVVDFTMTNNMGTDVDINNISSSRKIRAEFDDMKIRTQTTILLNDLSSFKDTVLNGESREMVLVFECDSFSKEELDSLKIKVRDADGSNTYSFI